MLNIRHMLITKSAASSLPYHFLAVRRIELLNVVRLHSTLTSTGVFCIFCSVDLSAPPCGKCDAASNKFQALYRNGRINNPPWSSTDMVRRYGLWSLPQSCREGAQCRSVRSFWIDGRAPEHGCVSLNLALLGCYQVPHNFIHSPISSFSRMQDTARRLCVSYRTIALFGKM